VKKKNPYLFKKKVPLHALSIKKGVHANKRYIYLRNAIYGGGFKPFETARGDKKRVGEGGPLKLRTARDKTNGGRGFRLG